MAERPISSFSQAYSESSRLNTATSNGGITLNTLSDVEDDVKVLKNNLRKTVHEKYYKIKHQMMNQKLDGISSDSDIESMYDAVEGKRKGRTELGKNETFGMYFDGENYTDKGVYIDAEKESCFTVIAQNRTDQEKYGYEFDWEYHVPVSCLEDSEDITCAYCTDVLCKPMRNDTHNCGHVFCHNCIKDLLDEFDGYCCVCDNKINFLVPDMTIRQLILMTDMVCPLRHYGCPWLGTVEEFQLHRRTCEFYEFKCECGNFIIRMNEETHNKSCTHRLLDCTYCGKKDLRLNVYDDHLKTCEEFDQLCPNACGVKLKFKDFEQHFKNDCTEVEIKCPFGKATNCNDTFTRGYKDIHNQLKEIKHLAGLANSFVACQENCKNIKFCDELGLESINCLNEILEMKKLHNNQHIWKITNWRKHVKNASNQKLIKLRSTAIELFPSGAKMQIILRPMNWPDKKAMKEVQKKSKNSTWTKPFTKKKMQIYSDENRQYCGIFFKLVKSDFDSLLDWPFNWKIKIILKIGSDPDDEIVSFVNPLNFHSSKMGKPLEDEIIGKVEDDEVPMVNGKRLPNNEFGMGNWMRLDKIEKMLEKTGYEDIFIVVQAIENEGIRE